MQPQPVSEVKPAVLESDFSRTEKDMFEEAVGSIDFGMGGKLER